MLDSIRRHARALASMEPAELLGLAGTLRGSDTPIVAMYGGNGSNLGFITTSLFDTLSTQRKLRDVSALSLPRALTQIEATVDIVIAERPPLWAALGGRIGEFRIPAWVRQELVLPIDTAADRWTLGRHLEREVQRQIRRHDYRLVLSDDETDKQEFFADFYEPYTRTRHGASAVTADQRSFRRVASGTLLAKLYAGEVWTAGMLLRWQSDSLRFGWFGSTQDPPAPGASEVLDVLCIKMAAARGIRRINFGNSRPSLTDGIVRYKSKFGAQLQIPRYPQTIIEVQIRRNHAALRAWLTRQQFLSRHHDGLAVAGYPQDDESCGVEFKPLNGTLRT